ncbi:MAG TPA: substrate-binding domain-containing protein [Trueperaceae bacterium]|nr:substrate-binding domain-containing protein [Trueperaceae bacterium]
MRKLVVAAALGLLIAGLSMAGAQNKAPVGQQFCKGVNITFFPGGPEGGPFASTVYRGAKAAQDLTGASVDYVWSNWIPSTMVAQFKNAVARQPDGIAVMGHPGDAALDPLIQDAEKAGIIVTSQNTTLPKAEAEYKAQGFGYVGQELYQSGAMLAEGGAKIANLQKGDRVMVWGLLSQGTRGQRTAGAVDTLKKMGMQVDYIEISDAVNSDPSQGTSVIGGYIAAHPDVKMIVVDHGALTATIPTYLQAAGVKPGQITMAGFDMTPATVSGIKDGYISVVLDQQPWLQGFLPIMQICLTKQYGFSGLHIDTGGALVTKDNIDQIASLVDQGIR